MTILQSIFLGILQGIAEFLPISSSGHLAVAQYLFKLEDLPLLYDVLLHLATLLAVCIYFRKKIIKLFCILGRWIMRRPYLENADETNIPESEKDFLCGNEKRGRRTILAIIITTFITGLIGIVTSKFIPDLPLKVTSAGFIVTAFLLIFSSIMEKRTAKKISSQQENDKHLEEKGLSFFQAVIIGIMQGIGTLPGISRSGSTIAGAQLVKVNREAAGEYSFIVSIPAILGAFVLTLKDYLELKGSGQVEELQFLPLIFGIIAAFVSGYIALTLLMKLIKKGKLEWFACYLIPLGITGLIFF